MKRVYLYAYDSTNFGDDLFIRAIVRRYPEVKFLMWTNHDIKKTFSREKNLKIYDNNSKLMQLMGKVRGSFPARYKTLQEKMCNASVYIGGSIFMEYPNWEYTVNWWNGKAENYKCFAIGCNFGPYKTEEYKNKIETVFTKMSDVCFRDSYSYNLFKSCSIVRYAPDILFGYPMPESRIVKNQIFVSVIDCSGKDEAHNLQEFDEFYTSQMADILTKYITNGCTIILSSFCKAEGDERSIQKILEHIHTDDKDSIIQLNYDGTNDNEILKAISESEYVIGSRFHAVIMALAAGRPVLPIIYSDKTSHVLEDIGFNGVVFDIRKRQVLSYEESRYNWDHPQQIDIESLKKHSVDHFSVLDKMLKG